MKKYVNGKYINLSSKEIEAVKQDEKKRFESITYEESVNSKIRERYTESQEFAILRQKDEKQDEFRMYYEYCEECKSQIKELLKSQI